MKTIYIIFRYDMKNENFDPVLALDDKNKADRLSLEFINKTKAIHFVQECEYEFN